MKQIGLFGHFHFPKHCISDEVPSIVQKNRLRFTSLRHLWRWRDILLSTKGQKCIAAVRPVLPYGSEALLLRTIVAKICGFGVRLSSCIGTV